MEVFNVFATLSLVDMLSGPLDRIKRAMKGVDLTTAGLGTRMGNLALAMAPAALAAGALLGVFGACVSVAAGFEDQMAKVGAVSRASSEEMAALEKAARDLGATTQFTAVQVGQAEQYLAMAGFSAKENIAALPGVLNLAAATATDLGRAADISSDILSAFGMQAEEMTRVADTLALTCATANVNMELLGDTMKYVAPVARMAGLSLEETAAMAGLLGNVGIKGGNTGARENAGYKLPMATFPTLENPVKTELSCFNWYQAIDDYKQMTATTAGIRGRERLIAPIKFIWNYAGNCLTNQHGGINQMHPILLDDKKCETIVVIDTTLTPSARYADFLLPSCLNLEEHDWTSDGDSNIAYVIFDNKCIEPLGEAKSIYDICAGVANELGVKEAFTEGRTQYQWLEKLYAESRKAIPELPPTLEEAYTMGVYKRYFPENHIAYKAFRDDPEANPLPSPSGKIEIYSPRLAELAETWTLLPGQAITALPEYIPNPEGAISPERKEWPLQLIGHHYKQRTHSTYGNCWWLQEVAPQELWINPIDAKARGIEFGDRVKVFNGRGVSFVKAKITPRIMPGVVSLPEGAWHTPNAAGEDTNGCVNVLTKLLPTALAKGNPHHTNLVQVEKA